jgi:hypothetical protein
MLVSALPLHAQFLLVPMDEAQRNHLKAYGVTFQALKNGQRAEWLLNYRGGAFLLPDVPDLRRRATLEGVTLESMNDAAVSAARAELAGANMDAVVLERAPRIAIYRPANQPPWDDAVTLALQYAGIDFTSIWDDEVMKGDLSKYDWVHLHHEDFTGQFNKLYLAYRDAPWFVAQRDRDLATARRYNLPDVPALKKSISRRCTKCGRCWRCTSRERPLNGQPRRISRVCARCTSGCTTRSRTSRRPRAMISSSTG